MRHNIDHRKLGRTAAHRKAMLGNMVTSLFQRERITTTTVKAREAKRQRAVERSREASEERKYPELRGLRGTERIVAKLGFADPLAISEALGELAQTPTEERPPEVARAIAEHLRSSDVKIQRYAAQALIHWGTRDVEAEVVEATQSPESLVAKYAQDALETTP